jgi:hypothetical protein
MNYYWSKTQEPSPIYHIRDDCVVGSKIPSSARISANEFPPRFTACLYCEGVERNQILHFRIAAPEIAKSSHSPERAIDQSRN